MTHSYKVLQKGASVGNPVGELTVEIDVANMGATEVVKINDPFPIGAKIVSCQVVGTGLTGTLNGTAQMTQSNDGGSFMDISGETTTLNAAEFSDLLEKADFAAKYIGVTVAKVGLTAGTIKLIFVVKH